MSTLARFTDDLTVRCRWAGTENDGYPSGAWSTGEQLAVALVLRNGEHLDAMGYTTQEAAQRIYGEGWWATGEDFVKWLGELRSVLAEHGKKG